MLQYSVGKATGKQTCKLDIIMTNAFFNAVVQIFCIKEIIDLVDYEMLCILMENASCGRYDNDVITHMYISVLNILIFVFNCGCLPQEFPFCGSINVILLYCIVLYCIVLYCNIYKSIPKDRTAL